MVSTLFAVAGGYVLCVFVPVPVMSGYVYRGWAAMLAKISLANKAGS